MFSSELCVPRRILSRSVQHEYTARYSYKKEILERNEEIKEEVAMEVVEVVDADATIPFDQLSEEAKQLVVFKYLKERSDEGIQHVTYNQSTSIAFTNTYFIML